MKKIKTSKLTLQTETIKQLDDERLRQAAGGVTAIGCVTVTCNCTVSNVTGCVLCPSGYTGCLCVSVNRTNCC